MRKIDFAILLVFVAVLSPCMRSNAGYGSGYGYGSRVGYGGYGGSGLYPPQGDLVQWLGEPTSSTNITARVGDDGGITDVGCVLFDGTATITTKTQSGEADAWDGTSASISVSGNVITPAAGTVANLVMVDGATYPLGEHIGQTAYDISGEGNDGTLSLGIIHTTGADIPSANLNSGYTKLNGAFETTWDYPAIDETEYITNGDVESALPTLGTDTLLTFNATVSQSTDQAHSGTSSVKVTKQSADESTGVRFSNASGLSSIPAGAYRYSVWVYIPTATTTVGTALFVRNSSSATILLDSTNLRNQWVNLTGVYKDAGIVKRACWVALAGDTVNSDVFYVDDFSITEIAQLTVPTTGTGYAGQIQWEDSAGNIVVAATDFDDDSITASGGDGIVTTFPAGDFSGHVCKIVGSFPQVYFNDDGDKLRITGRSNQGYVGQSTDQGEAYYGCTNLLALTNGDAEAFAPTDLTSYSRDTGITALVVTNWNIAGLTTAENFLEGTTLDALGAGGLDEMISYFAAQHRLEQAQDDVPCHFGLGKYSSAVVDDYLYLANTAEWELASGGLDSTELVTEGAFNNGGAAWDMNTGISIASEQCVFLYDAINMYLMQDIGISQSGTFIMTYEVIAVGGTVDGKFIMSSSSAFPFRMLPATVGHHVIKLTSDGSSIIADIMMGLINTTSGATITIDNISIREVSP